LRDEDAGEHEHSADGSDNAKGLTEKRHRQRRGRERLQVKEQACFRRPELRDPDLPKPLCYRDTTESEEDERTDGVCR